MTIGDRLSNGTYTSENKRTGHNFGNNLVKNLINRLYDGNYQDIMTGYRGFNRLFVKTFPVLSAGFEIETELSIHAMDKRFKLVEVPITYKDRPEGSESKLNTISDGIKVIKTIFQLLKDYKPSLFFGSLSLLFLVLGLLAGGPVLYQFIQTRFIASVPLAILSVGLMILCGLFMMSGLILSTIVRQNRFSYELYIYQVITADKQNKER